MSRRAMRWRLALRAVGLALFTAILARVDLDAVAAQFAQLSAGALTLAALMCAVVILLKGLRWRLLLGALGVREPLVSSVLVYTDSIFWGTLTPGRLGEFRKVQHLVQRHGLHWLRATWWSLLDRLFDLAALGLGAALALASPEVGALQAGWWPVALTVGALALGRALLASAVRGAERLVARSAGAGTRAAGLARALQDLRGIPVWTLLALGALSLASLAAYAGLIGVLASALPFTLEPSQVAISVTLTMAAGLLPISYMNFGTREAVLLALFVSFERSAEQAIAFSFLFVLAYVLLIAESALGVWLARRRVYS